MTISCEEDINSPVSWCCVDCGINTAPGFPTRAETWNAYKACAIKTEDRVGTMEFTEHCEVYTVRDAVWRKAGMGDFDGCLCIGCLEKRIGRRLKPKDFIDHVFNSPGLPCTDRLRDRRGDAEYVLFEQEAMDGQ
jgi:hypothetical protein